MKPLKTILSVTALTFAVASVGMSAQADPKKCPPGHAMKGWCSMERAYDRDQKGDHHYDRDDSSDAYLEGYKDGKRDAIRYGDRYYSDYSVIRDYDRYGLKAPPDGYYYANVDGDVALVLAASQIIQSFIN